jgi:hypothetical protein
MISAKTQKLQKNTFSSSQIKHQTSSPATAPPRFASFTKESKPPTIDMEIGCRFFFAETKSTAC